MASNKDAVIMGTNSYSIVSKRSVEHLYFADDPQFLAEFVPQLRRRSPLINRGYWIRMMAVEDAVKTFLGSPSPPARRNVDGDPAGTDVTPKKIVINLGCGEDTMPFRVLNETRRGTDGGKQSSDDVLFIDVDYPDLMEAKARQIAQSELICATLCIADIVAARSHPLISLRSPRYAALGADLKNLDSVTRQLYAVLEEYCGCSVDGFQGQVFYIAEVSITYMPTPAADALLSWSAAVLPKAESTFTLLEQILPSGQDHPFARTMLNHFEKSAPLQSVTHYPTLSDQHRRFTAAGWRSIDAKTLLDVWDGIDVRIRTKLEGVEPFDEWEEFALFCSHYVFLMADNQPQDAEREPLERHGRWDELESAPPSTVAGLAAPSIAVACGARRFGAAVTMNPSPSNSSVMHVGGYGSDNRLSKDADFTTELSPMRGVVPQWSPAEAVLEGLDAGAAVWLEDPSPFVLRKQDLGSCVPSWSPSYLTAAVGAQTSVTIHESQISSLDFNSKNFNYASAPFASLVGRAVAGEHVYLRALADGRQASSTPASLQRDFPSIAADFELPQELRTAIGEDTIHSSVLRIAGNIDMWLHYDVMANVLCQVRGHKRVVLFPPDCVLKLGFVHGSTTSGLDVFGAPGVLAAAEKAAQANLHDGDQSNAAANGIHKRFPKLPFALTCFTITRLPTEPPLNVLVGGRTSPHRASSSCWALRDSDWDNQAVTDWEPIQSLQPGRFRHSSTAVRLGPHHGVLVFGGKTGDGTVLGSWHVYAPGICNGWLTPRVRSEDAPEPRFGAAMCTMHAAAGRSSGWLTGGMGGDHSVHGDFWEWTITLGDNGSTTPELTFKKRLLDVGEAAITAWARFGSVLTPCGDAGGALLIGGVGRRGVLQCEQEVLHISSDLRISPVHVDAWEVKRPLLIGHSASSHNGETVVIGGGAVCFSFGSYWNTSATVLGRPQRTSLDAVGAHLGTLANMQPREVILGPGDCLFIPACWPHATAPGFSARGSTEDGQMNVAVNVFFRSLEKGYAAGRDVYGNRDLDCYQNGRRDIQKIRELLKDCEETTRQETYKALAGIVRGGSSNARDTVLGGKEATRIKKSVQALPPQLQRFYLCRLAAEIDEIATK